MNAIAQNWRYSRYRSRADTQYSSLWYHLAVREALAYARILGWHFEKNSDADWYDFVVYNQQRLDQPEPSDDVPDWKRERAQCG